MQWQDEGFVISIKKHGENAALATLLTASHGLHRGLVKGASGKRAGAVYQPGNLLSARWNARLSEHLGVYTCEPVVYNAARIAQSAPALLCLGTACAVLETTLPERHREQEIYNKFSDFVGSAAESCDAALSGYLALEFALLYALGFGLDLSCCAGGGDAGDLAYISPKSGRAVSRAAGEPYKAKLLPLPACFINGGKPREPAEILDGLTVTGYFLEHWVFLPHSRKIPQARQRLVEMLGKRQPREHLLEQGLA